jgi:hypothetical protein
MLVEEDSERILFATDGADDIAATGAGAGEDAILGVLGEDLDCCCSSSSSLKESSCWR